MVRISPFRALRYDPARAGELSCAVSPPYDVIDAPHQERLYAASPYNIVRLTLGRQSPTDTDDDNRYTRARRDYDAWCRQGILRQDAAPALYAIEHAFTPPPLTDPVGVRRTRLGIIAVLDLDDGVEGVLKHEQTLAGPKEDRTRLLEAVPANLEPIFCVYPDAVGGMQRQLAAACQVPPTAATTLGTEGVRLWVIQDTNFIAAFKQHLTSLPVLIADGHHRFEVGFANRERCRGLMVYFVSMADPALVVHPIHRLLDRAPGPQALGSVCEVEPVADGPAALDWVLGQGAKQGSFGYCEGGTAYRVRVRPEARERWVVGSGQPSDLARLDVSVLHGLLFPAMGVSSEQVRYTGNPSEVWAALRSGSAKAAWLLREIPLAIVYKLAEAGHVMPPKSTYFYPKVPSGLTINPFVDVPVR